MIVVDPDELKAQLVAQMRELPDVLDLLDDDPGNILDYIEAEQGDLISAVRQLRAPKILVYLIGVGPSRGFPTLLRVSIGMAVRAQSPTAVYAALLSGVSEASGADGQPLLVSTVHSRFDPMEIPSLDRRMIPVGETTVFDYWEISTAFNQRAY